MNLSSLVVTVFPLSIQKEHMLGLHRGYIPLKVKIREDNSVLLYLLQDKDEPLEVVTINMLGATENPPLRAKFYIGMVVPSDIRRAILVYIK